MSCYRPTHVYHWFHRVLHWSMAGSVAFLLPLGVFIAVADDLKLPEAGEDVIAGTHVIIGLFFATALVVRIIVLFAGTGTMGWRDVLPYTARQFRVATATIRYYLGGFKGKPPLYFGHNPFAGGVYTAFFCFAATQAASGITMVIVHLLNEGSAQKVGKAYAEAALIAHDVGALFIIFFICAHLGALVLHDIIERRGLASSMISGYKFFSDDELREFEADKAKNR
ncbi:MAG: cytochrome b/b6 domain-containing protein [Deltaproteobacteria bacterium]|nr:cytochrome b/b6 domain-containing protein [Deltaproteobacteria bacterium]